MRIGKMNRWKGKGKMVIRNRKKARVIVMHDDLRNAKQPPDWMRELLFNDSDDEKKAG